MSAQDYWKEWLPDFVALYILSLPRRMIRDLSQRWCGSKSTDSESVFNTVMVHMREANLPRTGYIVSLLLWAISQNRHFHRVNEAVLLENIIEYILDKADFTKALRRTFDFRSQQILLQSVAERLKQVSGYIPVNDLLDFIISFLRDKGLDYNANELLNRLLDCGILVKSDDIVSFKYRCF